MTITRGDYAVVFGKHLRELRTDRGLTPKSTRRALRDEFPCHQQPRGRKQLTDVGDARSTCGRAGVQSLGPGQSPQLLGSSNAKVAGCRHWTSRVSRLYNG